MTSPLDQESLPFSIPKQEALMGYLLSEPQFFLLGKTRIRPEWWGSMKLQEIWKGLVLISDRYRRPCTAQELMDFDYFTSKDLKDANAIRTNIRICVERRSEYGLDLLQTDLTDWFKTRIYLQAMKKSEGLFNMAARGGNADRSKLTEAFTAIRQMTKDIDEASFEPQQIESMRIEDIEAARIDSNHAVDFGLPRLNAFLNPTSRDPATGMCLTGLLKGDMTVLLAPTNVGKTTTMVTVAAANILSGKSVLLITHEGRISDIKLKIWQCMMEDNRDTLFGGLTNPKYRAVLLEYQELMAKHLEFMPMNRAGLTVEEVDAIVRRRVENWRTHHMGQGFDLIIDDYAAKLTTSQARGGNFALRQIHEVVYNYFSQMALEHDCHVLTAIQTNREGSRVNSRGGSSGKGHHEAASRFLTMEDVMESWGPMTTATNVISINRPPEAQKRNVTGFFLCKSRSSEVGVVFLAKSDFSKSRSHWPTWECEEYKLASGNGDRIEAMLQDFADVSIGDEPTVAA